MKNSGKRDATTKFQSTTTPSDSRGLFQRLLLGLAMALWVARPLFPSESASLAGDGLTMVMMWIVVALCWMLIASTRQNFLVRFGWIDVSVVVLIGLHTLAAVVAAVSGAPRPAVNMLWEWIGMGLAYLLARQLVATPREARAVVAVMIALAVGLSGYGLYQFFYEMPQTRAAFDTDSDTLLREAGLWFPSGSVERELFECRVASTEPIATFALTNSLAGYLVPWLVMGMGLLVGSKVGRCRTLGCLLPVAACLVLTKSRSAYVAVVLGAVLAWLISRIRFRMARWRIVVAGVVLGVLLTATAMTLVGFDRELLTGASKSLDFRVQYWRSTMSMIAEHPWLGCGPGNFQSEYTRYKLPEASEEVADPHNFLMEVWATAGTPAMLSLLVVLGVFVWKMVFFYFYVATSCAEECPTRATPVDAPEKGDASGPSGPWHVYLGAVAGCLLAVPLGSLSAAGPSRVAVLLGLPLIVASIALSHRWVMRGRMPAFLPGVAVVALLVNLLAAGGIGYPSVAGSFWLLLAIGSNAAEQWRWRQASRIVALGGLAIVIFLTLACYHTAYAPVWRSTVLMRRAFWEPQRVESYLAAATAADPLAARPWQQLAVVAFDRWRYDQDDSTFALFQKSTAEALRLAPHAAVAWAAAGRQYSEAFTRTGHKEQAQRAVEMWRRAAELYPNNARYQAELALAFQVIEDVATSRHHAERALVLDGLTPHAEKKLPAVLRERVGVLLEKQH